jgi:hypothetical protein
MRHRMLAVAAALAGLAVAGTGAAALPAGASAIGRQSGSAVS